VILATNRRAALDEAFLRRLRFSARFELPGVGLRRELWRRAFPPGVPCDPLDLDELAARELAGGTVQSSALAAAFLAAADGGRVRQEHILRALRREYAKLGKAWQGGTR
jgi:SpoVK/Ycf46/Vps4 family AAA+-type ATPase